MKRFILAVAIILSPLLYNNSLGCGCPSLSNPTLEEIRAARFKAFDSATIVFSGKVIELEPNKVKFQVEKIWKGDSVDEIVMVIQEKKDNGNYVMTSCDYRFKSGEEYLVYAYGAPNELRTHACSRTTLLKNAEQEMKGLDEIELPEVRDIKSELSPQLKGEI
jgi:hypothetical protein